MAGRADQRSRASRKHLVIIDTTAFSTMKVPAGEGPDGEEIRAAMRSYCGQTLHRRMSSHADRLVAFAVRDVIAHVDVSAEARIAKKTQRADQHEGDASSDSDGEWGEKEKTAELVDVGGGECGREEDCEDDDENGPPVRGRVSLTSREQRRRSASIRPEWRRKSGAT